MLDQITQQRVAETVERLAAEYGGIFSRATVEHVVADSLERLGEVTITLYVPVLTERFARDRLRAAAQAEGPPDLAWDIADRDLDLIKELL